MTKIRLLQTETEKHKQGFECYYTMGSTRSYDKVAKEFGVSLSAVKLWGRSFAWSKRIADRDALVAREVASRTLTGEISRRERNLKIVEMSLIRLAKGISEGRIKMCLADLDRLIRLEAFLSDQPDSRAEIVFADLRNKSTEELREMVRQEMEMLKELEVKERRAELQDPQLAES